MQARDRCTGKPRPGKAGTRLAIVASTLVALAFGTSLTHAAGDTEAARYQRCIAQLHRNAQAGLEMALSWIGDGGRGPAKHCAALALLAMGDTVEAAQRLEQLAQAPGDFGDDVRGDLLDQAGNAWLMAEDPTNAIDAFNAAIELGARASLSLEARTLYLSDRARARLVMGDRSAAKKDLDAAIALRPFAPALTLRARIEREVHQYMRAGADLRQALRIDPKYPDAFLERGRLRLRHGAITDARKDFIQAALLASDGPVKEAARQEIAEMDVEAAGAVPASPTSHPAN